MTKRGKKIIKGKWDSHVEGLFCDCLVTVTRATTEMKPCLLPPEAWVSQKRKAVSDLSGCIQLHLKPTVTAYGHFHYKVLHNI